MLSKLKLEHKFPSNVKIITKNKMFMVWNNAAVIYSNNNNTAYCLRAYKETNCRRLTV